ncbi:MAG: NAD(P)-dependent oxidoreductase [Firmicutes bacterium]|nr:NAD(P)-dependent oxidoreductase [Bacillota bacterium]
MLKVGIIGVGNIGQGMVYNLLQHGYETHIYAPRSHEDIEDMARQGAVLHYDYAELASVCDFIYIVVFSADQVEDVAIGKGRIFNSMKPGSGVAVCSTIDPSVIKRLAAEAAQRELDFIDCPVSGGRNGATNGTMLMMAACSDEVFEKYKDVLRAVGSQTLQVGKEPGVGQVAKATVQIMVSLNALVASEALILGTKAGIDPDLLYDILTHSYGTTRVLEEKAPEMLKRNFASTGGLDIHIKDLDVGLRLGKELGTPLFLTALAKELYISCQARGWGRDDFCSVIKLYEEFAQVLFARKES